MDRAAYGSKCRPATHLPLSPADRLQRKHGRRRPPRPVPAAGARVVPHRAGRTDGRRSARAGRSSPPARTRSSWRRPAPARRWPPSSPASTSSGDSRTSPPAACASSTSRRSRRSTTTSTATCNVPLEGVAETARRMGCALAGAGSRRPHRRHAAGRAAAPGPPAAARPHHHAGIAAPAADLARPRHAARRHPLHHRRNPRPLPEQARRLPGPAAGAAGGAQPARLRPHRPVGDAAAAGRGGALSRRRRAGRRRAARAAAGRRRGRRVAQGPRPARRQPGRAVRADAGGVGLAVDLPAARRADPRAPLDHRLRQRPPLGGAHHGVPQRRGRSRPRPPRQRLAGGAAGRWRRR